MRPGNDNALSWRDWLIVALLAVTAAGACYQTSTRVPPILLHTYDVWFESDLSRVYDNMADRWSDHYRTKVHPLFSLLTHPLVYALKKVAGIEPMTSIRGVMAAIAAIWISVLYVLLRLVGCRQLDAVLFSLIAACSAGSLFWFVVPETYPLGSLSILLALLLTITAERHGSAQWLFVVVSALTLSVTVTNWMAGIAAAFAHYPWKRATQVTINAFCLVVLLWGVQKYLFPSAQFFLGDKEETKYLLDPEAGGLLGVARSFFAHSVIMPAFRIADDLGWQSIGAQDVKGWPKLITQSALLGTGSSVAWSVTILWFVLIGVGAWSFMLMRNHRQFRFVFGAVLVGQFVLHMLYGNETFLYALHFMPLLVVLAALSTLTMARPVALIAAALLLLGLGINNGLQFQQVAQFVNQSRAELYGVHEQMKARPMDPWPRGRGHTVLAAPGTADIEKSYLEPGGSFSPWVGSFGVSIWLMDEQGALLTTSDDVPITTIRQDLITPNDGSVAGVVTETPYYRAQWSSPENGRWTLHLQPHSLSKAKLFLVLRSVGPAGGPVRSLDWDGHALSINNRWIVTLNPVPIGIDVGEEGQPGWTKDHTGQTHWSGESGWGYARLEVDHHTELRMEIDRRGHEEQVKFPMVATSSRLHIDVPDRQFLNSLQAQLAHIMMGLVGLETRPGDPMNYPRPWLRDGAYEVVALSHGGYLELAQALARQFAEEDFFGGFGPEADAPGLAIWALEDVAAHLRLSEYDETIWPHVRRKAEFIETMLDATRSIVKPIKKPIVPAVAHRSDLGLVCEASRNGLIMGRMDNQRPLLFVNAASYRGLMDAAAFASRIGQPALAQRWRARAEALRQAWERAFASPESTNDRTYVNALWPTGVARLSTAKLQEALEARWSTLRSTDGAFLARPLWTYFDLGEAHQWLLLGQPNRVWKTVRWFWSHQASPGLYTWWEGDHAENDSHRWDGIRGWLHPPHVTPHYWTAAEMALLQLDMLTYWDESTPEPTVVIGSGIPAEWLRTPMNVSGLPIPGGEVGWEWDGRRMLVRLTGGSPTVRLGPAFPRYTPIEIQHVPAERAPIDRSARRSVRNAVEELSLSDGSHC